MKKGKIHSLRFEISAVFISIMVGTFLMCLVVNLFFMERFYIQNKREAIIAAYRSISQAIGNGDITSEEFDVEIATEDAESIVTVQDAVEQIKNALS